MLTRFSFLSISCLLFSRRLLLLLTKTVDGCCAVDSLSWCAPTTIFRQQQETKKENLVFFLSLIQGKREREREGERPVAGEHFYSLRDLSYIVLCTTVCQSLSNDGRKPHINGCVSFLLFWFAHIQVSILFQYLPAAV